MSYVPIITPEALATHIYQEKLDEITRADSTIVDRAIAAGIAEAKIYLSRYDLVLLFGDISGGTSATFTDDYLTELVKDIVAWKVIKLSNPNLDYEHVRKCYEDAIATLKMIQSGKANPEWPYRDTSEVPAPPDGDGVTIFSNPKRCNY